MYPSFLFIRHAQSVFNKMKLKYPKDQRSSNWKEYHAEKFAEKYMDAELTIEGENSVKELKKLIIFKEIDIVVVSPLKRALQTCQILFGDQDHIRVFVQPLLTEQMNTACDIGAKIDESRERYDAKFNFSKIPEENQHLWYFRDVLSKEKREILEERLKKYNDKEGKNPKKCHQITCQYMRQLKQGEALETPLQLAHRTQKLKRQLAEYQKNSKKRVVLIGHSCIFLALTATGFQEDGTPINSVRLENAEMKEIPIIIEGYSFEGIDEIPFCKF